MGGSRSSCSTPRDRSATTVTIIGIKEEASKELEAAAAGPPKADLHWVSIGHLGTFLKILKDAGITHGGDGRAGQARQDLRHRAGPDGDGADDATAVAEHRRADRRGGRPDARARRRAVELRAVPRADAGAPRAVERARADRRRAQRPRVRLSHGRRDRGPRHRPDDRGEAPGRGRRRGDGRHRRNHRRAPATSPATASPSSRWRSRSRTCGSTCRSSGWRRSRRCASPARRCCRSMPARPDLRSRRVLRVGE